MPTNSPEESTQTPLLFDDGSGGVVEIDRDKAQLALRSGYRPASHAQIREHLLQQKYGGFGSQLATVGERAVGTALPFVGEKLLSAFGDSEEAQKLREEANPTASMIGTGVGIAAPALVSGGASLLESAGAEGAAAGLRGAAELSAPSIASKLGRAVEQGVAGAVEGSGTSLGKQVLSSAVSKGAGLATEGAWYGAGNVLHEKALGDPNMTWEAAAHEIGMGALLGGAFGAAGGALGEAVPAALGSFAKRLNFTGLRDALAEKHAGFMESVAGKEAGDATSLLYVAAKNPEMRKAGPEALYTTLKSTQDALEEADRFAAKEMKSVLPQMAKTADQTAVANSRTSLVDNGLRWMEEAEASSNPEIQSARSAVQKAFTAFEANTAPTAEGVYAADKVFTETWQLKRTLDDIISDAKRGATTSDAALAKSLFPLAGEARSAVHSPEVFGEAASKLLSIDTTKSEVLRARDALVRGGSKIFSKELGLDAATFAGWEPSPSNVKAWFRSINDFQGDVRVKHLTDYLDSVKSHLDNLNLNHLVVDRAELHPEAIKALADKTAEVVADMKTRAAVDSAEKTLRGIAQQSSMAGPAVEALAGMHFLGPVGGAVGALHGAYNLAKTVPAAIATLSTLERAAQSFKSKVSGLNSTIARAGVKAGKTTRSEAVAGVSKLFSKSPEEAQKDFAKSTAHVTELANSPDKMVAAMEKTTAGWAEHAPDTAQAAKIQTARAVSYLASKVPPKAPRGVFDVELPTSREEIAKFNRAYDAVVGGIPLVLKQAAAGTITPDAVDAIANVYPAQYEAAKVDLLEKVTKVGVGSLSQQQRTSIGIFLQDPSVMRSTIPGVMAANQAAHSVPAGKSQQNSVKSTSTGLGKINQSERAESASDKLANRK